MTELLAGLAVLAVVVLIHRLIFGRGRNEKPDDGMGRLVSGQE